MRVGYWSKPEGDDVEMTILPVGHDGGDHGRRAGGTVAALATRDGAALMRECPNLAPFMRRLADGLAAQRVAQPARTFALTELSQTERNLLADILGEGEVTGIVALPDRRVVQIQESVLAGLWRVRVEPEADQPAVEYLEIGAVPQIVSLAAHDFTRADLPVVAAPDGAMNVMPVLAELAGRQAVCQPGEPAHIVNFTLLPMNEVDMTHLQASLGNGPIQIQSHGYGSCRIWATGTRHVWSVQYFNAMDAAILDTLEVVDIPAAARAADEDFEDSAERLREIIEAYFE